MIEPIPTSSAPVSQATKRPAGKIRVLLVDDQTRVRRGLRMRLEVEPDLEIVGEAEDGRITALVAGLHPDVVVMDVAMPGVGGIEATAALGAAAPGVAVVILTLYDDAETRNLAAAAGAAGFVAKHDPEEMLVDQIRLAANPPQRSTGAEG